MTADLGPAATPAPRPVPSQEDRMRDATAQPTQAPACSHGYTVYRDKHPNGQPCDDARTPRTFATYLDRTERDQLDARAATAEAERDEALDDRDAYKEARDDLRKQLDAMKAAKKRVLGRLEKAEHVIDLIRDGQEQIDRALATYDTQPGEPEPEHYAYPDGTCAPDCPGCSAPALGSLPPRAQDEPDSDARRLLDQAIETALPLAGGRVEELLDALRCELARVDAKRAEREG